MIAMPARSLLLPWDSLLIWGLLVLAFFGLRDVFFIAFLPFLMSYLIRSIVVALARRRRPGAERSGLERWLTLGTFVALIAPLRGLWPAAVPGPGGVRDRL